MKKTILFLLLPVCWSMPFESFAQDFGPGQQAQGLTESKNVTVDYATGTFHYKIPLYTLRSGNFQLPVSLDYTGKGVKSEDERGLIDYNWTLNTGGVVTRTIRGGIADEISPGYALSELNITGQTPLKEDIESVNKRRRDGESDIFTAVFKGQSVNFIIRIGAGSHIYAEPLERTNVRIECEGWDYAGGIKGWVVTAENGDRYIYRQQEWTSNINKEDAVSFNGVRGKAYISSWYLSRIEPLNAEPVLFNYKEDVLSGGEQTDVRTVNVNGGYASKYTYGHPMRERSFDFSKYKSSYEAALQEAYNYLDDFSVEMQVESSYYLWRGYMLWEINPEFNANYEAICSNFRIMGQLANLADVGAASSELVRVLNDLYDTYRKQTSTNARMAAGCFKEAKDYVIQCLEKGVQQVTTKETGNGTSYVVRSPLLDNICCVDRRVEFRYVRRGQNDFLSGIRECDVKGNRISEVRLDVSNWIFDRLSFLDKDSIEINRMKFDYYPQPSGEYLYDVWGYSKQAKGIPDERYAMTIDPLYSKSSSLEKITFVNGGSVTIDYEPNVVNLFPDFMLDYWRYTSRYGGLRIKSLILDAGDEGIADTIFYSYPKPGRLVYYDYFNEEQVKYAAFSDIVLYSKIKFSGQSFLKTGNNGIYYPYVREITRRRGIKTYLFHVPVRGAAVSPNTPYAFWLNGLPLGTAEYDSKGNLKRIVKNKYYTDRLFFESDQKLKNYLYPNASYFVAGNTLSEHSQKLPQVKTYEYYMDEASLSSYYQNQREVFLYRDGNVARSISPYDDVYLPNIAPRTTVQLPEQYYELYYGGKTLLKEQLEYRFEGTATDSVAYEDFLTMTSGVPFQKIVYFYDNESVSVKPTRIERTDSRGDIYTTETKRVTEMEDRADPFVVRMKRANVVEPVVRQVKLKNNAILEETLIRYNVREADSMCFVGLAEKYLYVPETVESYTSSATDGSLFRHDKAKYLLENTYRYEQNGKSYLCVEVNTRGDRAVYRYDFGGNQTILNATDENARSIAAMDIKKYREMQQFAPHTLPVCELASKFMTGYLSLDPSTQPPSYQEYRNSSGHKFIISLIEAIVNPSAVDNYLILAGMLDRIRANASDLFRFRITYETVVRTDPGFGIFIPELFKMTKDILDTTILTRPFLRRNYTIQPVLRNDLVWKDSVPASGRLNLYVLTNGAGGSVAYSITHPGGTDSGNVSLRKDTKYQVQSFPIDLSSYAGEVSVTVKKNPQTDYFVLAPEGTIFEATSYHPDGTVFCTFDQTGRMELNEYDAAGRLIRVRDQGGNIVKEYDYNVAVKN